MSRGALATLDRGVASGVLGPAAIARAENAARARSETTVVMARTATPEAAPQAAGAVFAERRRTSAVGAGVGASDTDVWDPSPCGGSVGVAGGSLRSLASEADGRGDSDVKTESAIGSTRLELADDVDLSLLHKEGAAVTNATVQEVVEAMPQLRALGLDGCVDVTDAGMWAVARTAVELRRLVLSGLPNLTHVGLRSISLRCRQLQWLDISRCPAIDDMGLRVIASGLWGLQTLHMRDCAAVHDGGLVELLSCCRRLTDLDVSRSPYLTDKALAAVARYCTESGGLRRFAYIGSNFCTDEGLAALAAASPKLTALNLSYCNKLSGAGALSVFVARCRRLQTLALDGCKGLSSPHVAAAVRSLPQLRELFVAGCPGVKAAAYAAIARHGVGLERLRAGGTNSCDDRAAATLADTSPRSHGGNGSRLHMLRDLDLSGSPRLSKSGVLALVRGYTALLTLRLDRCKRIKRSFVAQLADELPLVRVGERWFGLEPVPDAEERTRLIELRQLQRVGAVRLQAWWRGRAARLVRARLAALRDGERAVLRLQSLCRGWFSRERVGRMRRRLDCDAAASLVQRRWRESVARADRARAAALWARRAGLAAAALHMQRAWRGHSARKRCALLRDALALLAAEAARQAVLAAEAALLVQCAWRVAVARRHLQVLRAEEEVRERQRLRERAAAPVLQRGVRCFLARLELQRRRVARILEARRQAAALGIQCAWRQFVARQELQRRRELAEHARRHRAATRLQAAWRGMRARHFSAIVRAFAHLRAAEAEAALRIQTRWRVFKAAKIYAALVEGRGKMANMNAAAAVIQAAYRGLKGRQAADVAREVVRVEAERKAAAEAEAAAALAAGSAKAVPAAVTAKALERLRGEEQALDDAKGRLEQEQEAIRAKMRSWAGESEELRFHGAAEVDSDKLTGVSQRYRADWLRKRMVEALDGMQHELRRLEAEVEHTAFALNDTRRRVRAAARVVEPTHDSVVEAVLRRRRAAFESRRELRRGAAARIQALWRAHALRAAVRRGANPWVAVWDGEERRTVYFNTITQRTRLGRPVDYVVWGGALPAEALAAEEQEPQSATAEASASTVARYAELGEEELASLYGLTTWEEAPGWFRGWDSESGAYYWWSQETGEYRWEAPDMAEAVGAAGEARLAETFEVAGQAEAVVGRSVGGRRIGQSPWIELYDPESRAAYYFNEVTEESAWSLPPSVVHEAAPASQARGDDVTAPADSLDSESAGVIAASPLDFEWHNHSRAMPSNATVAELVAAEHGSARVLPPRLAARLQQADRELFEFGTARSVLVSLVRESLIAKEWLNARKAAEKLIAEQRAALETHRVAEAAKLRLGADEELRKARANEALRCIEMLREDVDAPEL